VDDANVVILKPWLLISLKASLVPSQPIDGRTDARRNLDRKKRHRRVRGLPRHGPYRLRVLRKDEYVNSFVRPHEIFWCRHISEHLEGWNGGLSHVLLWIPVRHWTLQRYKIPLHLNMSLESMVEATRGTGRHLQLLCSCKFQTLASMVVTFSCRIDMVMIFEIPANMAFSWRIRIWNLFNWSAGQISECIYGSSRATSDKPLPLTHTKYDYILLQLWPRRRLSRCRCRCRTHFSCPSPSPNGLGNARPGYPDLPSNQQWMQYL